MSNLTDIVKDIEDTSNNDRVHKVASVSALATAGLVEGQAVELIGYHANSTVGGGSGVIATARHKGGVAISLTRAFPTDWSDQAQLEAWFADSGTDELCFVRPNCPELALTQFGVSDSENITIPLSSAIVYSKANGFIDVCLDIMSANISEALPQLNSSFNFVKIKGLGKSKTTIDVSGAGDDIFTYVGGSGGIAGDILVDIDIDGDNTQDPILIKGFGGAVIKRCKLNFNTAAKLSNDVGLGTFTEFVILDDCDINVNRVFSLTRGAGNDSFHGCGWRNGTIINAKTTATELILVGAPSDSGRILLYNAPMDGTIFKSGGGVTPLISKGNSQNSRVTTKGTISIETPDGTSLKYSDFTALHAGDITDLSNQFIWGNGIPCVRASINPDGSYYYETKTYAKRYTKPIGETSFVIPVPYNLVTAGFQVDIIIRGASYNYTRKLTVSRGTDGSADYVDVKDTTTANNTAGYGGWSANWVSGELTITNGGSSWSPVELDVFVVYHSYTSNLDYLVSSEDL